MTTEAPALTPGRQWPRAELTLALLAVLSLPLNFIHIKTIYEGLPAHPLLLHVPVILIPVATIGALVFSFRTVWWQRYGVALATVAVVALAGLFLTIGAGDALRSALGLTGGFGPAAIIAQHEHAAHILRLLFIAFTIVILATVYAYRSPTNDAIRLGLRIGLCLLAAASAYYVWRTGDLGAKAVWQNRLHGGGFRGGGFGGGGGFPFGPGSPPGG